MLFTFNFVVRPEMMELPPDKLVVVWILIRRDETASPICVDA